MVKYLDDTGLSGGVSITSLGGIISTAEISAINGNKNAGAQTLLLNMATAVQNATLTALGTYIAQGGVTAGAGVNQMGIYDSAGNRLGVTADMTTAFAGTGLAEGLLTAPVAVVAGKNYYLAILTNYTGTTVQTSGVSGQSLAHGATLGGFIPNLFSGAQASLPASFNPAGLSAGGDINWMYGR